MIAKSLTFNKLDEGINLQIQKYNMLQGNIIIFRRKIKFEHLIR